jgi:hypothetical protein
VVGETAVTKQRSSRREVWGGAGVLLLLLLGYMLFWWNRGIQLNSNGEANVAAQAILAGKLPYRDFQFWCPPGYLLTYTALAAMFGDGLIYVRAFAVVERLATFLLVYFWLARVFSAQAAFFGTFAAAMGFSSDAADALVHYDFDAVLTSVAAGFAASVALSSRSPSARLMYFATGICAGLCMVAKQTQGVGIFMLFLVIFAISGRLRAVFEYLLGWAIPTGLVAWWLARGGAWHAFIQQTFLQGTSSKGSLGQILIRPLALLVHEHTLLAAFVIAVGLVMLQIWLMRRDGPEETPIAGGMPWIVWLACLAALVVGFVWAWWLPNAVGFSREERLMIGFSAICIFIGLYGNVVLATRYTVLALWRRLDADGLQKWVLAAVSAVTAYMFSLSWAAYEKMLIPGFAFLLAMAIDHQLRRRWGTRGYLIAALGLVLICTATFRKLTWPYEWQNWVDGPIKQQTTTTDFPELRGLRVTPATADFLSTVTRIIEAHSQPNETILCFPNYALFYVLAHRKPGVFAYMHWFDIVPDALARQEAQTIREHPPAVILVVDFPESLFEANELRFRGGHKSGQRDMLAAIQSLPGYHVIETIPIPQVDYPLKIYAKQ